MATSNNTILFESPSISVISGSFSYLKYDRHEYTRPCTPDGGKKRFVSINWETPEGFETSENNLFLPDGNNSAPTIILEMQTIPGMFSLTPVAENQWEQYQTEIDVDARAGSFYDRYLRGLSSGVEANFDSLGDPIESMGTPVYDPTSGAPIIKMNRGVQQVSRVLLSECYADYISDMIKYNPLSETKEITKLSTKLETLAAKGRANRPFRMDSIDSIQNWAQTGAGDNNSDLNGKIVGYAVQRFDSNGTLNFTHVVATNRFTDFSVLYGQTYSYIVYPLLWVLGSAILIHNEAKITIVCEEKIPPEPPKDFNIQWDKNDEYVVTWLPNYRKLVIDDYLEPDTEANVFTQDVKGYQIFRRSDLTKPYELVSYIKFSDLWPLSVRNQNALNIPKRLTHDLEGDVESYVPRHPTSFRINLASNRDHYVAMCAVDARGNPSGYSSQWRIYRNSVTGKIDKELISPMGAPRNQPNLLQSSGIIKDSFDVSGLSRCTIYFNPDSEYNVPDFGNTVDFQFFDTKTDTYQSHKITITQNSAPVS